VYGTTREIFGVGTTLWFDAAVDVEIGDLRDVKEYGDLGTYFFTDTGMADKPFDTPHLNSIYNSPPYLHNGAARTLEEIWTRFNISHRHGFAADMTRGQFNDMIAYLKAL
jgi:cytochrome c peroxidase